MADESKPWTAADSKAEHLAEAPDCCDGCEACPDGGRARDGCECSGCQRTCECYLHGVED